MYKLSIVTAEKTIFEGDISSLVAPTINGEIGILTGHREMITKLDIGGLRITNDKDEEQVIFVAGGFLEVAPDGHVTILADTAENIEDIALEQVQAAKEKAKESLANATDQVSADKFKEELRLMMMRERLAEISKYRKDK